MLPSRAAAPNAGYPTTTGAVKIWLFEAADEFKLDGFGWVRPGPPSLIVASDGQRTLRVSVPGREPLVVANTEEIEAADSPCRVKISADLLTVTGRSPGHIRLELQKGTARMPFEVTVKDKRVVPIVAHYVEQGPARKTRMTLATLCEMIETADAILRPKANVRVVLLDDGWLTHPIIGENLGRTVRTGPDAPRDEWDLVTRHAVKAKDARDLLPRPGVSESDLRWLLNLFLVRRFEDDNKNDEDDIGQKPGQRQSREAAATVAGKCVLEDEFEGGALDRRTAGKTLAHEICHHLRLEKHAPDRNSLMYKSQPHGEQLSLDEAHRINPSGCGLEF